MSKDRSNEELLKQGRLLQADVHTLLSSLNYSQAQLIKKLFSTHREKDVARLLGKKVLRSIQTHDRPARS